MSTASDALIIRLAIKWWKSRRPCAWNEQEHLEHPAVNTVSDAETALAVGVAMYVKNQQANNDP